MFWWCSIVTPELACTHQRTAVFCFFCPWAVRFHLTFVEWVMAAVKSTQEKENRAGADAGFYLWVSLPFRSRREISAFVFVPNKFSSGKGERKTKFFELASWAPKSAVCGGLETQSASSCTCMSTYIVIHNSREGDHVTDVLIPNTTTSRLPRFWAWGGKETSYIRIYNQQLDHRLKLYVFFNASHLVTRC